MALEFRRAARRPYFYRARFVDGRVQKTYVASGEQALLLAAEDEAERQARRQQRAADRDAEAAALSIYAELLESLKSQESLVTRLRGCHCAAAGWKFNNRQWRSRRK